MKAKIYKPAKTAMQSGRAKYNKWVLKFSSKEDAINYAKKNNIDYEVLETSERKVINKSYADNFK